MKKVSRERVGQELDGMFNGMHFETLPNSMQHNYIKSCTSPEQTAD